LTYSGAGAIMYLQGKEQTTAHQMFHVKHRKGYKMMNMDVMNYLINGYNELSAAHKYIFGFKVANMVYMTTTTEEQLPYLMILDKASRGQGYALRFKPNKAQKALLMQTATPLCSVDFFEELTSDSKYNKGEIFEKLVTEHFGQEWKKDNVPFTEAGDITINGEEYQIKYEKATFTNEKSLNKMMVERA